MNVTLCIKDRAPIRKRNVEIIEDLTRLVIQYGDDSYTVVPLVSLNYYDVDFEDD